MATTEVEIDDSLYSRQRYVLGDSAMQRMAKSSVLLCGMGGLGVEIAKNIVLAGIKNLTVQDSQIATVHDLGTQFFLREEDVQNKRNRAEASVPRLAELNPYVSVKTSTAPLDDGAKLEFLKEHQCVILTEAPLSLQLKVNEFCRAQSPPIKFISADVYGVFCSAFVDFGDVFEVVDENGEEPKEVFIGKISKGSPGVVSCLEDKMHGLTDGDTVSFKEIQGMTALNGKTCQIKVLSPTEFSICDTSGSEYTDYLHGGMISQIKTPKTVNFESLAIQLQSPSILTADLCRFDAPPNIHLGLQALHMFRDQQGRLPNVWCKKDAEAIVTIAKEINQGMTNKVDAVDEALIGQLSCTSQGSFAPLCAALGGIVAQEGLKALTGKFMPLKQWLYFDATELLAGLENCDASSFQLQGNRNDALRICIGEELCRQLADLRLFMVGCGAIGCEMLKNYALLGIATTDQGRITITDNDLIEKSNLNRQFLFRPHHIQKPKSTTAAASVCEIHPGLRIEAQQHKVCPQTEQKIYNDTFFTQQNLCVNALDNVEARRYMDSRCVSNQRALLESGTMGAKGHVQVIVPHLTESYSSQVAWWCKMTHQPGGGSDEPLKPPLDPPLTIQVKDNVQVIVPHLTESYSSQRDPPDEDIPYCTLKSFPAVIEHCIQWARDKFESSFNQKPNLYNKFWSSYGTPDSIVQKLSSGQCLEGAVTVSKLAQSRPISWEQCVYLARQKFEKYFNHKARNLTKAFPLDIRLKDGSLFWQSPKRPPTALDFDSNNPLHVSFISSTAQMCAAVSGVKFSKEDMSEARLREILKTVSVPEWAPSNKAIVVDESVKKPDGSTVNSAGDDVAELANRITDVVQQGKNVLQRMHPAEFEKDDDDNGHIDFITAASNLRASMYSIEPADRLKTKRIAGRIVPAIATTTAAVAGLVTVELLKIVKKSPLEHYKNCFLNLALPVMVFSEPGPVERTKITEGLYYTIWDKWEVHGNKDFTLQDFINYFLEKHGFEPTMVVHGVKMIYVPFMPGHKKRLPHTMLKLIKPSDDKEYVDLVVSVKGNEGEDEDVAVPAIRYFFSS